MLVCDDYEDVLNQLRMRFCDAEFDAEFVSDGQSLQDRALDEDFDLVVTDLAMSPVDGWTAIEAIRELKPELPIWAVSAYSNRDMMNMARARQLNVNLMEKPDGIINLRELIERFFNLESQVM